ncbi:MAG: Nramp family divalent metal transporter [Candidatus Aminicenantes bacterium]|nr:Nramp family divalent metal transporter [Candidatus Aminicenantes bacterium]
MNRKENFISRTALGLVVAATGVGAGDLLTASLAGSIVGPSVLWAAWVGALLKFVLNEGIARWQMATGKSILEGWLFYLPPFFPWLFFVYFLLWSFYVGGALINACGVAGVGFLSLGHPGHARFIWGILHSLAGLIIVLRGGFEVFQRLMAYLIATMVMTVFISLILIQPDWVKLIKGIIWPTFLPSQTSWSIAVMGGIGGTVTIICYNYWVEEKKRRGWEGLRACRFDLSLGYTLTAFFGLAMIIIGSKITVRGRGDEVALQLAEKLGELLGPAGKWLFLTGFWSAVFSSLLGVWQGVPYIFTDFLRLNRQKKEVKERAKAEIRRNDDQVVVQELSLNRVKNNQNLIRSNSAKTKPDLTRTLSYRLYLVGISFLPLFSLFFTVQKIQLIYAFLGALFMPFLALTLLILNNQKTRLLGSFRNSWLSNLLLLINFLFFSYVGWQEIKKLLLSLF